MKKSVLLSVLGLGLVTVGTTAYGQGGITIKNYQAPFNPVVWSGTVPDADHRVASTEGVVLTLFYGPGTVADPNLLTLSTAMPWDTAPEGNGYFGYYAKTVSIAGWTSGSTWSFQLRASGASNYGPASGSSVIWQESSNIQDIGGTPPGPAGLSQNSIGFTVFVPEPSTFALAGLGTAALMIFRRRKA